MLGTQGQHGRCISEAPVLQSVDGAPLASSAFPMLIIQTLRPLLKPGFTLLASQCCPENLPHIASPYSFAAKVQEHWSGGCCLCKLLSRQRCLLGCEADRNAVRQLEEADLPCLPLGLAPGWERGSPAPPRPARLSGRGSPAPGRVRAAWPKLGRELTPRLGGEVTRPPRVLQTAASTRERSVTWRRPSPRTSPWWCTAPETCAW